LKKPVEKGFALFSGKDRRFKSGQPHHFYHAYFTQIHFQIIRHWKAGQKNKIMYLVLQNAFTGKMLENRAIEKGQLFFAVLK
jgi:hypothetical protein